MHGCLVCCVLYGTHLRAECCLWVEPQVLSHQQLTATVVVGSVNGGDTCTQQHTASPQADGRH